MPLANADSYTRFLKNRYGKAFVNNPYRRKNYQKGFRYYKRLRPGMAFAQRRMVFGLSNKGQEMKAVDYTTAGAITTYTVPGSAAVQLLNGTAVGTGSYQREGRIQFNKSLTFELHIFPNQSATAGFDATIRFMIFVDTQANGSQPQIGNLLTGYAAGGAFAGIDTMTPRNLDYGARFKMLRDWTVMIDRWDSGEGTAPKSKKYKMRIPLNFCTVYNASTAAYTSVSTNALWLMYTSDGQNTSAGTYCPYMEYNSRVYFTD